MNDTDIAYRFEYADGSAFEIQFDGRAFIAFPGGRREEKRGKITNNIRPATDYPSTQAMKAAVDLEIKNALGDVQTVTIGRIVQKAINASDEEARQVCAEAYQVVGSLLSDLGQFDTEHGQKILDNLSQAKMVHSDVLPWPSFEVVSMPFVCPCCGARGYVAENGTRVTSPSQSEKPKP